MAKRMGVETSRKMFPDAFVPKCDPRPSTQVMIFTIDMQFE